MKHIKKFENYSGNVMYVVYTEDGEKHSAWEEKQGAIDQIRVLKDNGYKGCYTEYEEVDDYVTDGYYFV